MLSKEWGLGKIYKERWPHKRVSYRRGDSKILDTMWRLNSKVVYQKYTFFYKIWIQLLVKNKENIVNYASTTNQVNIF